MYIHVCVCSLTIINFRVIVVWINQKMRFDSMTNDKSNFHTNFHYHQMNKVMNYL